VGEYQSRPGFSMWLLLIQVLGNIHLIKLIRLQVLAPILAIDPAGQKQLE
jgi:hypothetical protein